MTNLKGISLFTGCGGMDFAAKECGIDVLFANDIIPETKETFSKYFQETDFHCCDIRQLTKFPSVEIITGGYPCQSFSMGGNRKPENDSRTFLFNEFARVVDTVHPKFFIAENVSGLQSIQDGQWLKLQLETYNKIGKVGYRIAMAILNAQDFGVPQRRKRVLIVGVRKDLDLYYHFPRATHTKRDKVTGPKGLLPFTSHGEAIRHLPLDAPGEYYERAHDPEGNFSWYYMSRNRKANWADPSYTIVANFRHTTLHPASPKMKMLWSNLSDGFKQKWVFSEEYEHLTFDSSLSCLEKPRRLSWREAAAIQTFPVNFEPAGNLEKKFAQIGNAVPPRLMKAIIQGITTGSSLHNYPGEHTQFIESPDQFVLFNQNPETDKNKVESETN